MKIFHENIDENIEKEIDIIKKKLLFVARHYKSNCLKFEFNLDKSLNCVKLHIIEYDV